MAFPSSGPGPISRAKAQAGYPGAVRGYSITRMLPRGNARGQFPDYLKSGGRIGGAAAWLARSFILTSGSDYSLPLGVFVNRFQINQLEFFYARRRLHLH